ncbi:MAG: DivIVA domain-containing protein [Clostridium sp.]|nr:DivIVA domain-containing protein [Clostridium sp.]
MHYTPNELQNLVFKKSVVGGYNEDMVNGVLDKVTEDYLQYIKENTELKDKINVLNDAVLHYKNIEESLQDTLLVAQQTGNEIKKNSYDKAENIIRDAQLKAQQLVNEANQEVLRIKFEYEEMKKEFLSYKSKAQSLLLCQLEMLKPIDDEVYREEGTQKN